MPAEKPGVYDVTVYTYNPDNGNTGLDRTTFIVPPERGEVGSRVRASRAGVVLEANLPI